MKRNLLFLFLFALPLLLLAKERTQSEALIIATDYFKSEQVSTRAATLPQLVATSIDFKYAPVTRAVSTQSPAFYIYNNGESGFVIVSGDDRMKTILGYSDKGAFKTKDIPQNIVSFLASYVIEMNILDELEGKPKVYAAPSTRSYPSSVSPLLGEIMWNQSAPYYDDCPEDDGENSVTGCVATAMAQVLKYHEYPTTGQGSFSYTTETNSYSCSFDYASTTFEWDEMLDQYISGEYTTTQASAVATLMYACGVSVSMDYTSDESGAEPYDIPNALTTYFGYDTNIAYIQREYFLYTEWMDMIMNEISSGRPVLYDGVSTEGGHEFVFDGYDDSGMVHVNWGWAGMDNGYFLISDLNPSSPGIGGGTNLGGGYTSSQGMNIGIQPPSSTSTYTSYFTCSEISLSSTTVSLGSSFSPTISMLVNMSSEFTGNIALIFDQNGTQNVISSGSFSSSVPTQEGYQSIGWSSFNSSSTLPTSLTPGNYVFYAATQSTASTESKWSPVRGIMGAPTKFNVVVTDTEATFTPYWDSNIDITATLEVVHDLYIGKTGEFTLTYANTNTSREYYGTISIALLQDGSIVDYLSSNDVYMTAGQAATTDDVSVTIESSSSTELSAGTYQIAPVAEWAGEYVFLGAEQTIELYTYSGTSDITATNTALSSTEIGTSDELTITATLTASGTAPVYIGQVAAALFESGGSESINVFYKNVYIPVGSSSPFSLTIQPNVSEGNYSVALYKPESSSETQMTDQLSFIVKTGTGIEELKEIEGKVVIYKEIGSDVLYVRAPEDVKSADIYTATGQLIKRQYLVGTGTEFTMPIDQLVKGTYIIVLRSDDTIYREKFVK